MIEIKNISKSYPGFPPVIQNLSLSFEESGIYCLMGESGSGKTTLLRLIAGLEKADTGTIDIEGKISMMFQEDRLIDSLSAVTNLLITTESTESTISDNLSQILDSESCRKPVCELSGGQKRRVALARAVMRNSRVLLLDEPFSGLDDHTRKHCIEYILRNLNGRTLIVSTHNEEDAKLLGAEVIRLREL